MKRKMSIRLSIIALVCSLVIVLLGTIPLFDRHNDAQILMMLSGAFGAGAAFRDLLLKLRERKTEKET